MKGASLRRVLGLGSLAIALAACGGLTSPAIVEQATVVSQPIEPTATAQVVAMATMARPTNTPTEEPIIVEPTTAIPTATDTAAPTQVIGGVDGPPTDTTLPEPPTAEPPTAEPPTAEPPTAVPPTAVPPTPVPLPPTPKPVVPTAVPIPPTAVPVPPTKVPPVAAPPPAPNPAPGRTVSGPVLPRGGIGRRPWMVMIDNHPDAYPQSGMDKAAVVFEALAEYGITRYIATYADGVTPNSNQIGPVRSVRSYFAEWGMGFHPVFVHAGGSPDGLELVQGTNQLINFEALVQPKYSFRDNKRVAPHNLYTTSALLRQFAADKGVGGFGDGSVGYLYAAPAPLAKPQATGLNYYFLDKSSAAGFVYSASENVYYRTLRGRVHVDRITGAQLWTNNVVVIQVNQAKRAGDDKARIDQQVIGSGGARIFKDGALINGSWVKNSAAGPLRFYDAAGNEIVFSRGSIWIAAIPSLDRLAIR